MKLWFKKLTVPENSATKEVEVVQLWYVKWNQVYHYVSTHWQCSGVMEAFTSEQEANEFAASLKAAMALLKDGPRIIIVEKN